MPAAHLQLLFLLRRPHRSAQTTTPARTTAAAPHLPLRRRATARTRLLCSAPPRRAVSPLIASRAVSPLIAAPPPPVVPGRRASSPSPVTRVRREKEPQRVDPGPAASISREKGEGTGEIYFFSALPSIAALSQRVFAEIRW